MKQKDKSSVNNVEILVATMGQKSLNLYSKMNIQSDVIFANQDDEYRYEEAEIGGRIVRMITTPDRGVGKNRNKALLYAKGDILLFGDDDFTYADGYENAIIQAYEEMPDADAIIFGCNMTRNGIVYKTVHNKNGKLTLFKAMRYGAVVFSIKRESWLRANVFFSHLFGGGCRYSAGEDSLFIRDCFKRKLKIYTHEYVLGNCEQSASTWFQGYTEKYFYDKGVLYSVLFPKAAHLMCLQFALRHREQVKDIKMDNALLYMFRGIRAWNNHELSQRGERNE